MADDQFDKLKDWARENEVETPAPPVPATPLPDTPAAWFSAKFPALEKRHGLAVEEVWPSEKEGKPYVKDLSEDFLAATLGEDGAPKSPSVFVAAENRFYTYSQAEGIFGEARESKLGVS